MEEGVRKPVLFAIVAVSLAVVAALWWLAHPAPKAPETGAASAAPESAKPAAEPATPPRRALPAAAAAPAPAPAKVAVPLPVQQPVPAPRPVGLLSPGPAASAYTRGLIGSLTSLNPGHGPLTPEQVQAWKQDYEKLIKAGAESVPAIREFLAQNVDVNLKSLPNGDQLGASSVRHAMFDALRQIGGADAAALSAEVMQNTANPQEIALLAANLESMAPGQYGETAMAAARIALANAAADPTKVDVAPLFQVLQSYGGANALSDFLQAATKYNYYAPIALAQIPNGPRWPK